VAAEAPIPLARLANLDFEGSCYPSEGKSFPIEAAVVRVGDGEGRTWLIRPEPAWADWTWDADAAASHGIAREQLEREGLPAAQVWAELAAFVAGFAVVSDSESDDWWLQVLAEAAGAPVPFEIGSSAHQLKLMGIAGQTQDNPLWRKAAALARARWPQAHRALPDAQRGAEILRLVAGWNGWT